MKNQQIIFIVIVFIMLSFCCSFQSVAQTSNNTINQELLVSLTIDELKITKKKLLRQKKYHESDLVDLEIQKRYKKKPQTKEVKEKITEEKKISKIDTKQENKKTKEGNNITTPLVPILKTRKLKAIKEEQYLLITNIKKQMLKLESNKNSSNSKVKIVSAKNNGETNKIDNQIIIKKEVKLVNNIKPEASTPIKEKEIIITKVKNTAEVVPTKTSLSKGKLAIIKTIDAPVSGIIPNKIKPKTIVQIEISQKLKDSRQKLTIEKQLSYNTSLVTNTAENIKVSKPKNNIFFNAKRKQNSSIDSLKLFNKNLVSENNITVPIINKEFVKLNKAPAINKTDTTNLESDTEAINKLESEKQIAINNKKYLLADKLEKQINSIKDKSNLINNLEEKQQVAINNKEYLLADKLEKQIQTIKIGGASKEQKNNKEIKVEGLGKLVNKESINTSLATIITKEKESVPVKKIVKKLIKKGANDREDALLSMMSENNLTTTSTSNSNSIISFTSSSKVTNHSSNSSEINYKRSSLYTLMIENTSREYSNAIRNTFGNEPIPEKFNNHNIGPYLIHSNVIKKDQSKEISYYLNTNDVAKKLVAKWFNRNEKGEFNMQLVAERGNYNATDLDVVIARNTERGEAILADAGEELIGNTFVIINDYKYTNKQKVAKKTGGFLKILSTVAAYVPGGSSVSKVANYTNVAVQVVGKGYVIKTTSYLYKLVWNQETAATFYNDYWIDANNFDESKKRAFDNSNVFQLKYIGSQNAWADIQSTAFSSKSNEQLIRKSTIKATNKAIAKLQRKYDKFKTKSPIIGVGPVAAKIGLKEGLEKGDKFEVLEQVLNKKGLIQYKRVGVVTVEKRHIWDNRFMANEENYSQFEYTTFKGANKKAQVGMFLRQLN